MRSVVRGLVLFVALVSWPQQAFAQWNIGAFAGTLFDITNPYSDPAKSTTPVPTSVPVWGVSGGTNIFGKFGFEAEYQKSNNVFRKGGEPKFTEDDFGTLTGENHLQSLTAGVHYGWPIGKDGRFRPFVAAGGGINFINLGVETMVDFDTFDALPLSQQQAISNCFDALGTQTPTLSQVQGCNIPLINGEQQSTQRGVLTFGGGTVFKITKHIGARADVRYFVGIPEDEKGQFSFWRFTVGVVFSK